MEIEEIANEMIRMQKDSVIQAGLRRSTDNFFRSINNVLKNYSMLIEIAEYIRSVREKVLGDLEYYIDKAIKSISATGAHVYFAKDSNSALEIIDRIIGDKKRVIVKAKSMVTEEIMLREHLIE
ncbi:MAG: hypothetical protein QXZ64_02095, partial [Candidatus Bathyarchaeia archaeon]